MAESPVLALPYSESLRNHSNAHYLETLARDDFAVLHHSACTLYLP